MGRGSNCCSAAEAAHCVCSAGNRRKSAGAGCHETDRSGQACRYHEVQQEGNVLLFLDEVHTLIGAGGAEGALDAANILKPALARGEFQLIGATTISEYRKYIEKDAALERRFQPVTIEEPSEAMSIRILKGLRPRYESFHGVTITDDAITSAVKLSERYITDRNLPDKAIDVMDETCSKVRLYGFKPDSRLTALEKKRAELEISREEALKTGTFEKATELNNEYHASSRRCVCAAFRRSRESRSSV